MSKSQHIYLCRVFKVKSCSWSLGGTGGGIVETLHFLLNLSFPLFYWFVDLCSQSEFSVPFLVTHFVHWYLLWVWLYLCMPQGFSSYQERDSVSQSCRSCFFLVQYILALEVSGFACLLRIYKRRQSSEAKRNVCICDSKRKKKNHSCSDQIPCQLIWKLY